METITLTEGEGNLAIVVVVILLWVAGHIGFVMGNSEREKEDERNGVEG